MGLINRAAVCHRSFGYADADLIYIVRAKAMLLDQFGERVDDSLHCPNAGIELEPDAHDLEVAAETTGDFFRLGLIGEDFQKAALAARLEYRRGRRRRRSRASPRLRFDRIPWCRWNACRRCRRHGEFAPHSSASALPLSPSHRRARRCRGCGSLACRLKAAPPAINDR